MEASTICPRCGRAVPEGADVCLYCSAQTVDTLPPFSPIAGYELIGLLGSGGMGRVYLAKDETLGRRVAIKVMSEAFADNPEDRARFLREARSMATVDHPHVVHVYAFGEAAGKTYLVMEYIEGETLADRIRRVGSLPVEEALRIVRETVQALDNAWEQRLVHRDIKPTNILLDKRGHVRVADFGLAKPIELEDTTAASETTGVLGTPHYVSPEQARGRSVDFRSDVYSLGIVLYEMLSGERPFEGRTPFEIVDKHLHQTIPSLPAKVSGAPREVLSLVEWMTSKEPGKRPASYAALLEKIDQVRGSEPSTAAPTVRTDRVRRMTPRVKRLTAALLTVAGVGVIAKLVDQVGVPGRPPPPGGAQSRLVIAVTPFYGPDEESAREGKVMAALVERNITRRLGTDAATVLGVEEAKQPVRSHEAARALGKQLGAAMVVWGDAFVLRGETEIQPYLTMVPPEVAPVSAEKTQDPQRAALLSDPLDAVAALQEREAGPTLVQPQVTNQIELRKTGATGVGDLALLLAGTHALYVEGKPDKALALFEQVPPSAESLRYRAEALLRSNRSDDALKALQEVVALGPPDVRSHALLADLQLEGGQFADAVANYRRAAELGGAYTTRQAILYDGKLYAKELSRNRKRVPPSGLFRDAINDSGYMLALDSETGVVVERHRLPGFLTTFAPRNDAIEVTYDLGIGYGGASRYSTITFSHGRFERPVFYGPSLQMRRQAVEAALSLAGNFTIWPGNLPDKFVSRSNRPFKDLPATLAELEQAVRRAIERDPTQPWYPFLLGQATWSQGHQDEAEQIWTEMLAGSFPAVPYFEYAWMAYEFERFGQRQWADRAYDEALRRRKQLLQPIDSGFLIERLINFPRLNGLDNARAYTWFDRARQIMGLTESDDFVAAVWERYFRERGDVANAQREAQEFTRARGSPIVDSLAVTHAEYAIYALWTGSFTLWGLVAFLVVTGVRGRAASSDGASSTNWRRRTLIVIARIPREQRQVASAAMAIVLVAAVLCGALVHRTQTLADLPASWSDSFGHEHFIQFLEAKLKITQATEVRFAAAVANQLAGNSARARELYLSLSPDPRAARNLDALQKGDLVPVEPLSTKDIYRAKLAAPLTAWIKNFWDGLDFYRPWNGPRLSTAHILFLVNSFLSVILLLAFWLEPVRRSSRELPKVHKKQWRAQTAFTLLPGTFDIDRGSLWRGCLTLELFWFVVVVAFGQFVLLRRNPPLPAPGLFSGAHSGLVGGIRAGPLPMPPSRALEPGSAYNMVDVLTEHYWTLFWAYPYAKVFWTVVALSVLILFGLHVATLRRIWSLDRARE